MSYSWLLVAQSGGDAVQELFEVDFSTLSLEVWDHVEDGGVFRLEPKTLHGRFQLTRVDFACGFSIEEVEGLSELLDFVFSESWSFDFLLTSGFNNWLSSHLWNKS